MRPIVKICGVQEPEHAFISAKEGADLIGIMLYPSSRRFVPIEKASEICLAAREGGAQVVVVVVEPVQDELDELFVRLSMDYIQIYGTERKVPEHIGRIYVNADPSFLRKERDFLLLDHAVGGQGIALQWDLLDPPTYSPWLLAGGLTCENVGIALSKLKPDGVDVSSGIETNGKKDLEKIKQFIRKVRSHA
jgi:phosphoribosylanthranilate isomerase